MTETINQETDLQKEKTLEEAFEKLGELAERLEDSETSLEDSFRFYKEGMELLKSVSYTHLLRNRLFHVSSVPVNKLSISNFYRK